jgi:hypothetical protein
LRATVTIRSINPLRSWKCLGSHEKMTPPVVRLGVWIGFTRVPNSFHSSTVNKQVTKNLSDVLLVIIYDYSKKTADTMDFIQVVRSFAKLKTVRIDNLAFRLHYQFTGTILGICFLITVFHQYLGKPADCTNLYSGEPHQTGTSYCYQGNMFIITNPSKPRKYNFNNNAYFYATVIHEIYVPQTIEILLSLLIECCHWLTLVDIKCERG